MENSTNNSNDTFKVIAAFAVGALAGAALGVLFAPDKGSKIRSKIAGSAKDMAEDFKKKMMEEANALRSKAEDLEQLAENKLHEMANGVKVKVEALKHQNHS